VTGNTKGTVQEIIPDLKFCKMSTKLKEWLPHLKIFAITKMRGNILGKHHYRR
jgi:hypothetical protein